MNIVVLGGGGFVGSHLVKELAINNHKVTVFDIKEPNLSNTITKKINFFKGDITSSNNLDKILKNANIVYHLAGLSDLNDTLHKPKETVTTNILGTVEVLQSCVKNKIKRLIYASTIYVYSKEGGFYKCSKIASENYIKEFSKMYNLDFTILRYGSIYGPGSDSNNGVYRIIKNIINDKVIQYEGSPETTREYVHVKDVARASIEIIHKKYKNKSINISGNNPIKIYDFIKLISEILNIDKKINFKKNKQLGHYTRSPYSYEEDLGFKISLPTQIELGQGLLQIIKEIKNTK